MYVLGVRGSIMHEDPATSWRGTEYTMAIVCTAKPSGRGSVFLQVASTCRVKSVQESMLSVRSTPYCMGLHNMFELYG
jgi:hypothetical protein